MKAVSIPVFLFVTTFGGVVNAGSYQDAVADWKSHNDVANWLESNFSFQKSRQKQIGKRLRAKGPSGLLVRNPDKFYKNSSGYCADSANFAITTLNNINPAYNARWVFIWNNAGRPNHWVAAFDYAGRLYIMDYGTGRKWRDMQGVHGPYTSLDEYREFLTSLDMPGFKVGEVTYRDMPGEED